MGTTLITNRGIVFPQMLYGKINFISKKVSELYGEDDTREGRENSFQKESKSFPSDWKYNESSERSF